VVWLAGVGTAVALFVSTVLLATGSFEEFVAPGSTTVRLDNSEERGIYVQTQGSELGTVPAPSGSELGCSVRAAGGRRVVTTKLGGVTLSSGGDEYEGRLWFEAPAGGRYRVDCRPTARVPIAVGPKITALELVLRIGGIFVAAFLGLGGAAAIIAVVYLRRGSHKRRLQQEQRDSAARAFGR
jgi:hypothetical protein